MSDNNNTFKSYTLFNEVENPKIRAWNRCMLSMSAFRDGGRSLSTGYLKSFDEESIQDINYIFKSIQTKGYKATRDEVMGGFVEQGS